MLQASVSSSIHHRTTKTLQAGIHPSRPRRGAPWHGPSPAPSLRGAPPGGIAAGRAQRGAPRRTALSGPAALLGPVPTRPRGNSREQLDSEHRLCFPAERHGGCAVRAVELFRELRGRQPSCPRGTAPGAAPAARGSSPFPELGE